MQTILKVYQRCAEILQKEARLQSWKMMTFKKQPLKRSLAKIHNIQIESTDSSTKQKTVFILNI